MSPTFLFKSSLWGYYILQNIITRYTFGRILRIPYRSHRWLLAQLGQQKNLREHLHIELLRYITYALNHCNPIVKKFSNIALRCALSPMGANIALLRYLYNISFDRKLHINESESESERYLFDPHKS